MLYLSIDYQSPPPISNSKFYREDLPLEPQDSCSFQDLQGLKHSGVKFNPIVEVIGDSHHHDGSEE
jgi:hypothetical protein